MTIIKTFVSSFSALIVNRKSLREEVVLSQGRVSDLWDKVATCPGKAGWTFSQTHKTAAHQHLCCRASNHQLQTRWHIRSIKEWQLSFTGDKSKRPRSRQRFFSNHFWRDHDKTVIILPVFCHVLYLLEQMETPTSIFPFLKPEINHCCDFLN